jgi:LysM repeat protein
VAKGDTLAFIAEAYAVSIEDILSVNDIGDGHFLSVGQVLIIPLSNDFSPLAPTAVGGGPTSTPRPPIHVVEEGENLSLIAAAYGTTVEAIRAANSLGGSDLIRIGQELRIPGASYTPTVIPTPTQAKPRPTRTPSWKYAAPVLLGPVDGTVFRGQAADILLNWASVGILESDEWYVVRVRAERTETGATANSRSEWTKNTSWRLPDWMYPSDEGATHVFRWEVTVVRRSGDDTPEALSPRSHSRSFTWY